jgi:hypothetical protein
MTHRFRFDCHSRIRSHFFRTRLPAFFCCAVILATVALLASCDGSAGTPSTGTQPPNTEISITFTGSTLPTAFAEQIGTGNWTSVPVPANGQVTISVPSGTSDFAYAFACSQAIPNSPQNFEDVFEATIADGTSYQRTCPFLISTDSVTGTADVSAIPGAVNMKVFGDFPAGALVPGTSGPFQLFLPAGTSDLAVGAVDSLNNLLGIKIIRGQTVPGVINGGNTIALAATDATIPQPITVSNTPPGFNLNILANYQTPNGADISLIGTSPNQYASIPSSEAHSGDSYFFSVSAGLSGQSVLTLLRQSAGGPVTIQLPTPMTYVAPTPAPFPTFTLNYTGFSGSAGPIDTAELVWSGSSAFYFVTLAATASYLNGATTITLPDLTSLAGFAPAPASGVNVNWTTYISSGISSSGTEYLVSNFGNYKEP